MKLHYCISTYCDNWIIFFFIAQFAIFTSVLGSCQIQYIVQDTATAGDTVNFILDSSKVKFPNEGIGVSDVTIGFGDGSYSFTSDRITDENYIQILQRIHCIKHCYNEPGIYEIETITSCQYLTVYHHIVLDTIVIKQRQNRISNYLQVMRKFTNLVIGNIRIPIQINQSRYKRIDMCNLKGDKIRSFGLVSINGDIHIPVKDVPGGIYLFGFIPKQSDIPFIAKPCIIKQ